MRGNAMTKEHLHPSSTPVICPGDLLDEKEAAACLKVAVTTLRNWRALKQGPQFPKIGARLVRYRRSDLAAFISHDSRKDAA